MALPRVSHEFVSVSMMQYLHLTLGGLMANGFGDSAIVVDLTAKALTPDERLRRLGEIVEVPVHSKARSLLILAEKLPTILVQIENGEFNSTTDVPTLYLPDASNTVSAAMLDIINHWSIATGHDIKSTTVTPR